jgi:hypothetical protein
MASWAIGIIPSKMLKFTLTISYSITRRNQIGKYKMISNWAILVDYTPMQKNATLSSLVSQPDGSPWKKSMIISHTPIHLEQSSLTHKVISHNGIMDNCELISRHQYQTHFIICDVFASGYAALMCHKTSIAINKITSNGCKLQ